MNPDRRLIAAIELALIFPAALFLAAVGARYLPAFGSSPVNIAQHIVTWYSGRLWSLWVLLTALPLAALLIGTVVLLSNAKGTVAESHSAGTAAPQAQRQIPTRIVLAATLAAGLILVVVAGHVLAN